MYNEQLEQLIDAALADGVLTEKEKQVLFKKAQSMGIDLDEFEMVLDARLVKTQNEEKEKAAASAPRSNKFGDVRKCPVCGAIAQAYQAKCPECGYEFSNVDANLSSQKLAAQVMNAKKESDKEQCITLFPIPNTKTDLLEFLTSLQPKMRDVNDPLSYAYFKKYQECIAKAKVSFSSDPLLVPFIESFASEEKAIKQKRRIVDFRYWMKSHKHLTRLMVIVIIIAIVSVICNIVSWANTDESNDSELCAKAISSAIENNDLPLAQKYIDNFQERSYYIAGSYLLLTNAYIENDEVDKAEQLVDKFIPDNKYNNDEVKKILTPLYEYLMSNGRYEEAEKYIVTDYGTVYSSDYYNYMKECVEEMCKNGKKEEAINFIKRKIVFFEEDESREYSQKKVTKKLNSIISTY